MINSHIYTYLSFLVWLIWENTYQICSGEVEVAASRLSAREQKLILPFHSPLLCISSDRLGHNDA